mgnify:CR=1 FL=1
MESMIAILENLIGECPPGLDFLQYFFSFLLVAFGLFVVGYIAHLPFEFISNRFHH